MNIQNTLTQLVQKNMTQAQIATELQCSQSTVSDMLCGKIGKLRPSYAMVMAIQELAKKHRIKQQGL